MSSPRIQKLPYNWSTSRGAQKIVAILAHGTAGTDSRAYLSRGGDLPDGSDRRVSIHALIPKSGDPIYRYVPDSLGANHAGFGTMPAPWARINPNRCTLGFELENLQNNRDPYPEAQLLSMGWLINEWRRVHGSIPILRHGDIDPTRRTDPVGLAVSQMETWATRAAVHFSSHVPALYRALAPMWISETPSPKGPIALDGKAIVFAGETVVIDEVRSDGFAHLQNGVGFVGIGGLMRLATREEPS